MTPLGLLSAIRKANLHDDEARILLAIGSGFQRYSDIRDRTGLKDWQLSKILKALAGRRLVEVEHAGHGAVRRGKCSVYSLTGDGIGKVREILADETGPQGKRPTPAGKAMPLSVKAQPRCFLQQ